MSEIGSVPLAERHLADLRGSGLSEATIRAAGIYSADATEAKRKGFGNAGPGLVFLYPSHNGAAPFCRLKPDIPRTGKDGRPAKYLTVKGAGNRLYIPPTLSATTLADARVPLLLTEGEKKALKAIQEGFCCVGLSGVWCWLTRDGEQSLPLEDFERIAWKNRITYIVFDSDLAVKLEVQQAEWRLSQELQRRGAVVKVVRLPGGENGEKVGLDDFLMAHDTEALRQLLAQAQEPQELVATSLYRIQNGCLGFMKKLGRGDDATEIFSPLCNFTAQVVEERTLDDGVEVKRRFVIEGQLAEGPSLPRAEISAAQFSAMRWPVECWGVRARICAGMGAVDRLREAIQFFSADVLSRCAYIHTGWRKRNGAWHYLHAGLHDPEVLLEPPLNRYTLPVVPQDVPGALGHSLALLGVAPDTVTIPLLAMVYLAPLCEFLRPDFAVYLVGRTGSLKSTLAALFLSHYGNFPDKTTLPASWESTDNALERRLFILKDTLAVVDDYAPRADVYSQRRQAQRAQRIIRAMGNLSGRARLSGDLSERPEHPPRGLLLSTGEDLPPGQSILARILSVEVDRNRLNLPKLTESQHRADRLPHAIAGYIEWLAPQLDELAQVLPAQWREHRARFTQKAAHLRIPEILAYLALGIDLLTSFARDLGVLTPAQVRDLAERTRAALLTLGEAHGQRVKEEDPAEVFLSTFAAMLAQGAIRLDHKDRVGEANREIVGWKDGEYAYLIPDAARHAVGHYLQESGSHFPYSARALYEALDGRGALVKGVGERGTVAVRIGGKRRRVLQIPLTFLEPEEEGEAE